jgi:CheY-like chemotaxis protein
VEENEQRALLVGEAFSGQAMTVRMARSREKAVEECLSFHPHLFVFDIEMPEADSMNLIGWLREREILTHLILVAYSGRELKIGREQFGMNPTALMRRARVQPEQLEQLVLTILRGSRHIESVEEVADVSGVASA